MTVFTVLAERSPGAPDPDWLGAYESGVRHYRGRDFESAAQCFQRALALQPRDWLIQEYLHRAENYASFPPPPEWDGVYVMTQK